MKILHIIDHFGLGGAQHALPDLLAAWPNSNDELHVLALGRPDCLRQRFEDLPRVTVRQLGRRRWDWPSFGEVAWQIRRGDFDIVHTHLAKSTLAALSAQRSPRCRLVIHLRCQPQREHWLARWALRNWHRRADAFLAVSQSTATEAQRRFGIRRSKLFTVYNCLAADCLPTPAAPPRREHFPAGTKVFGYIGRLHRDKGLMTLMDAFAAAQRRRGDLALLLVGDGPQESALRAAVRRRGLDDRVQFAGFQRSTGDWIGQFSAGVLPSLSEGLPMSLVEVQAAGKPVIATAVGGTPEIIQHEINGLLVPPGDPAALTAAMLRVAADPAWAAELGRCGRRQMQWMFSPEANSRRVRAIYSLLLGANRELADTDRPSHDEALEEATP